MKTREKEDKKEMARMEVIETDGLRKRGGGSCENGVFLSMWRQLETKRIPLLGEL